MSKFGWDLPPGVTTNMLPGNTPEDAAAEAMADAIYDALTECGYYDVKALDDASDAKADKAVEVFSKLLGDAYAKGHADGMSDESMAQEFGLKGIKDVGEIIGYLQHQAALRSQENDEAGCLLKAADKLREDLVDLDPHVYGGLNYDG